MAKGRKTWGTARAHGLRKPCWPLLKRRLPARATKRQTVSVAPELLKEFEWSQKNIPPKKTPDSGASRVNSVKPSARK